MELAVHRQGGRRQVLHPLRELWVGGVLRLGCHPHEVSSLERPVILRRRQGISLARPDQLDAGCDVQGTRHSQRVHVEADAVADAARPRAPVAQVQRQRVGGVAWRQPHRHLQRPAALPQFHDVAAQQRQPRGGGRRDERRVVPGQLGQRLRKLLQPGVVGEPPVVDVGIGSKHDLEA